MKNGKPQTHTTLVLDTTDGCWPAQRFLEETRKLLHRPNNGKLSIVWDQLTQVWACTLPSFYDYGGSHLLYEYLRWLHRERNIPLHPLRNLTFSNLKWHWLPPVDYSGSTFYDCDFAAVDMDEGHNFSGCNFFRCKFRHTYLPIDLVRVGFRDCLFSQCDARRGTLVSSSSFHRCTWTGGYPEGLCRVGKFKNLGEGVTRPKKGKKL